MSEKTLKHSKVITFYIKRLKRFYPLYLCACILMLAASLISGNSIVMNPRQFFLSLAGLSCIIGPAPVTLWYFSMLIFFYLITPWIKLIKSIIIKASALIIIFVLLDIAIINFNGDQRLLIYYPLYFIPFVFRIELEEILTIKKTIVVILAFAICCTCYSCVSNETISILLEILISITGTFLLLYFSKIITSNKIEKIVEFISYSSMCAYLFHNIYYWAFQLIIGKFSVAFTYIFLVPSLIALSWLIQKTYDLLLHKVEVRVQKG